MSETPQVFEESTLAPLPPSEREGGGEGSLPLGPSRFVELREYLAGAPSWVASMLVHVVLLLLLALTTLPLMNASELADLIVSPGEELPEVSDPLESDSLQNDDSELVSDVLANITSPALSADPLLSPVDDVRAADIPIPLANLGAEPGSQLDLLRPTGSMMGNSLQGRGIQARGMLVRQRGGNEASEKAVQLGIQWLVAHQMQDGGWNFDHRLGGCNGRCRGPGNMASSRNAATAMALLPFLGAGQTHVSGDYQQQVSAGLRFLLHNMKKSPYGASLHESGGRMYSHGLASIALCEAYAMTGDSDLYQPAVGVLRFIVNSQDPVGGGWRYEPGQAGDTSAFGWQIMALKSGVMAGFEVPPIVVKRAAGFLNYVSAKEGARYGYTNSRNPTPTLTAVGLLSRMYMGWKPDRPAIRDGVAYLAKRGPSPKNMYYNYYATQVMSQFEGESWKKWNKTMRDYLVANQAGTGHETGSWYFDDPHGSPAGGRLYNTSMATMILEVYYRHLPLYGKGSTKEEFPE